MAEIVRNYDSAILAESDLALATKDNFVIYNRTWNGSPVKYPGYVDYSNAKGVSIKFPESPKSFYDGERLVVAQGADWSFATNSSEPPSTTRAGEFYWGPMISEMVMLFNPDGPDQSEPPDLVAPLDNLKYDYFPFIIR